MADPAVVVLGGGLSGSVAAWMAAKAGLRVTLLRRGQAATAVSSGAIDLAMDPAATPEDPLPRTISLETLIAGEIARNPSHLFARLTEGDGPENQRAGRVLTLFSLARKALEEMTGIRFAGDGRTVELGVTHAGTVKQTALLQGSLEHLGMDGLRRRRVGFCGIRGIAGWDGERAALVYAHVMAAHTPPRVRGFNVELPEALGFNANPLGIATLFDDPDFFDRFIEKVRIGAGSNTYDQIFFPPVFGYRDPQALVKRAGEKLSARASETLSSVPSVPGARLQDALERALSEAGVELRAGDILGAKAEGGAVRSVEFRDAATGGTSGIPAGRFVVSTGKFTGGGMTREKVLKETVFGLPVFLDGREALGRQADELFSRDPAGPHPAMRAGLLTDRNLRPLDAGGGPVFSNLLACGNVLAGYDYVRGGTGLGAALITGYLAGEQLRGGGK